MLEDKWSADGGASDWVDMERAGGGGWREGGGVMENLDQRRSLSASGPASFGLGAYALMLGHAVVTFAAIGLKASRVPADDRT